MMGAPSRCFRYFRASTASRRQVTMRAALPIAAFIAGQFCVQHVHAQECLLHADFESGVPAGWDLGPQVEVLDAQGEGTGTFVDAWRVGNATEANANGYFPVPAVPPGNHFIMANDDAAPCDCDMSDVALTSPSVDLGSTQHSAMSFRAYHEGTFGSGDALVEASVDGGQTWSQVLLLPIQSGTWQELVADLSSYDGAQDLRVRFRWSDGGNWSSGVAFDDICIHGRVANDLRVEALRLADMRNNIFDTGGRALPYALLPVEQALPVNVSAVARNRGTLASFQVVAEVTLEHEGEFVGTFTSDPLPVLAPGSAAIIVVETGWLPDAPGNLSATVTISASAQDQFPQDNSLQTAMRFTGPEPAEGSNTMSLSDGPVTGSRTVSRSACSPAQLFELVPGSTVFGLSVLLGPGSQAGSTIRAVLLDSEFNEFAVGPDHVVKEEDVLAAGMGDPLYLPLEEAWPVPQFSKVLATMQVQEQEGDLTIGTTGFVEAGASYCLAEQIVAPVEAALWLRLHLGAPVLSIPATQHPLLGSLTCHPNPFTDVVHLVRTGIFQGPSVLEVHDLRGVLLHREMAGASDTGTLHLERLAPGTYILSCVADGMRGTFRLVKADRTR